MAKVKDKKKNLKVARDRVTYQETPVRLSTDFSAEALQARREWRDIFKVLEGKTYNLGYSAQQDYHAEVKER